MKKRNTSSILGPLLYQGDVISFCDFHCQPHTSVIPASLSPAQTYFRFVFLVASLISPHTSPVVSTKLLISVSSAQLNMVSQDSLGFNTFWGSLSVLGRPVSMAILCTVLKPSRILQISRETHHPEPSTLLDIEELTLIHCVLHPAECHVDYQHLISQHAYCLYLQKHPPCPLLSISADFTLMHAKCISHLVMSRDNAMLPCSYLRRPPTFLIDWHHLSLLPQVTPLPSSHTGSLPFGHAESVPILGSFYLLFLLPGMPFLYCCSLKICLFILQRE